MMEITMMMMIIIIIIIIIIMKMMMMKRYSLNRTLDKLNLYLFVIVICFHIHGNSIRSFLNYKQRNDIVNG